MVSEIICSYSFESSGLEVCNMTHFRFSIFNVTLYKSWAFFFYELCRCAVCKSALVELNTCHITNNSYSQTKLLSMSINSCLNLYYTWTGPSHHYTTLFKGKHFYLLIAACMLYEISKSVYKLRESLPRILGTYMTPKPISRPPFFFC